MPNVAATERVSTSPPVTPSVDLHANPLPMPVLQLATKLCGACSRPLHVRDTQQRPMVPVVAARAGICSSCGQGSKAEGDCHIGRNRANSSSAPAQPMLLPLASVTPTAMLTVAMSSVSNDNCGRLQFPQQYSPINPSQDARSLGISPYSPTRASYALSRIHSPTVTAGPLDLHTTTTDPLVDISRLRVRSTGIGCLNPGETFLGIQTNQGKEHEVSVTIMVSGSPNFPQRRSRPLRTYHLRMQYNTSSLLWETLPRYVVSFHKRQGTRRVPNFSMRLPNVDDLMFEGHLKV